MCSLLFEPFPGSIHFFTGMPELTPGWGLCLLYLNPRCGAIRGSIPLRSQTLETHCFFFFQFMNPFL